MYATDSKEGAYCSLLLAEAQPLYCNSVSQLCYLCYEHIVTFWKASSKKKGIEAKSKVQIFIKTMFTSSTMSNIGRRLMSTNSRLVVSLNKILFIILYLFAVRLCSAGPFYLNFYSLSVVRLVRIFFSVAISRCALWPRTLLRLSPLLPLSRWRCCSVVEKIIMMIYTLWWSVYLFVPPTPFDDDDVMMIMEVLGGGDDENWQRWLWRWWTLARINSQNDKCIKGSRQKEASRGRCCGEIDLCLHVQIFFFNWTIIKITLCCSQHTVK